MSVESLRCPGCGAPVPLTAGVLVTTCGYCGSALRVERGASGHPKAALTAIRSNTDLIARTAAAAHLESRLQRLQARRDAALDDLDRERERRRRRRRFVPGFVGYGLVSMGLGVFLWFVGGGWGVWMFALGVALWAACMLLMRQSRAEKDTIAAVRALDREIGPVSERVEALADEVDRLIGEA